MSTLRVDEIGNASSTLSLSEGTILDLSTATEGGSGIVLPTQVASFTNQVSGSPIYDRNNKRICISDGISKVPQVSQYATPSLSYGIVEDGLEAYYDASISYDKDTNRLLDLSGNGRHMGFYGNARYARTQVGYKDQIEKGDSLVFDGTSGTWVQTLSRFDYNPLSFTVVFYNYSTIIRENSIGGSAAGYQGLLGFVSEVGGTYGYGVTLGGWTSDAINESVQIWSLDIGGLTFLSTEIPIGYNIFTFNWNVHEERYDMWINGWKMPVFPGINSGHAKGFFRKNAFLRLGGVDYPGYVFYGEIFTFSLYGRPLTDIEVIKNHNVAKEYILNRRSNRGYNNQNSTGGLDRFRG